MGEAADLLHQVHQRLVKSLTAPMDECQRVIDQVDSACASCVDVHCDQAETIFKKCGRKIDEAMVSGLAYCYNLLTRFGVTIPSTRELEESAATGGRPLSTQPAVTDQLAAGFGEVTETAPQAAYSPLVPSVPAGTSQTSAKAVAAVQTDQGTSWQDCCVAIVQAIDRIAVALVPSSPTAPAAELPGDVVPLDVVLPDFPEGEQTP